MWKKYAVIAGCVGIVLILGVLFLLGRATRGTKAQELKDINEKIHALKLEQDSLNQKLSEVISQRDEALTTEPSEPVEVEPIIESRIEFVEETQEVEEETGVPVQLCFTATDASFYTDIYPLLRAKGLTGTIVLKSPALPDTDGMMTSKQLSDLLKQGWNYAVDVETSSYIRITTWTTRTQAYLDSLEQLLGQCAVSYYFAETPNPQKLAKMQDLGITTILTHDAEAVDGLETIHLYGYTDANLAAALKATDIYAALEISQAAEDGYTTSYSKDAFTALLENGDFVITKADNKKLTSDRKVMTTVKTEKEVIVTYEVYPEVEPTEPVVTVDYASQISKLESQISKLDEEINELYK